MKLPKSSLYRRIRKIRANEYRRGRSDAQAEYDRLIEQLKKERDGHWATFQSEIVERDAKAKKQLDHERSLHQEEMKGTLREQSEIRNKDRDNYKNHINNLKTEAMKKIANISAKAQFEVERAVQREAEYQSLISQTAILLAEAMAKLKIYAEENQNMMGNIAQQMHRQNEIEKLYQRYQDMNKSNSKLIGKLKQQQIEAESKGDNG